MNFGTWLKHLRKSKGLTLQQVGDNFGITRAAVSDWESGRAKPAKDKLAGLARLYGTSLEQLLMGNTKPSARFSAVREPNPPPYGGMERGQVPYIASKDVSEWLQGGCPAIQGRMFCPVDVGSRAFVTLAHGVAMSPQFNDGDFLFIDPDEPQEHGAAVLVLLPDGAPVVRELQVDGETRSLKAANPEWPGSRLALLPEDATIAGVVVGKWVPA